MSDPADATRLLELTHVFDAPREDVFEAWIDPDQVAQWWGPEGLYIPRESVVVEPRVGGRYDLTMVDRESGGEHHVRSEIVEISPPELLVLRSEPVPDAGITWVTTTRIVLEADGERTLMRVTNGPYTDEAGGNAEAGWRSVIDNLDALLRSG